MTVTKNVTTRTLIARINRRLRGDDLMLRKPRTDRWWTDLGHYYVVDLRRNAIVAGHVDPEQYGREIGVLRPWEHVENE